MDAVLQAVRNSPAAAEFGDTWNNDTQTGVQKFFADFAAEDSDPYAIFTESNEKEDYFTAGYAYTVPSIVVGTLNVSIFAVSRKLARTLGGDIANVLNDYPLTWITLTNFMGIRIMSSGFAPVAATGPGIPTVFNRVLSFEFAYQTSH